MNTKVKKILTVVIITVLVIFSALMFRFRAGITPDLEPVKYKVRSGDTLWDIAEINCPDEMDIREYIYRIYSQNDISATIYPGQVITIFKEPTMLSE